MSDDYKVEYIDRGSVLPPLAYIKTVGDPSKPTIIHSHGLCNDMEMDKPANIHKLCQSKGYSFIRYDLTDHGKSHQIKPGAGKHDGKLLNFDQWKADLTTILGELVEKDQPVLLFGDSVGFWLSLLVALDNPDRVKGMCGLSAGIDFWERWHGGFFVTAEKELLAKGEVVWTSGPYGEFVGCKRMETTAARHKMLIRSRIALKCPFRFVHRLGDVVIPIDSVLQLIKKLESKDVQLHLLKGGDHRMIFEEDDVQINKAVNELLAVVEKI